MNSSTSDCYVEAGEGDGRHHWRLGNSAIELGLSLTQSSALEIVSLQDKQNGTDYAYAAGTKELSGDLEYKEHRINETGTGGLELEIVAADKDKGIELSACYEVFPQIAVIEGWIVAKGVGKAITIDGNYLSRRLEFAWRSLNQTVLHYVNGTCGPSSDAKLQSFKVMKTRLEPGVAKELVNSSMHSGEEFVPWAAVMDEASSAGLYFGLEWSGPWEMRFEAGADSVRFECGFRRSFYHQLSEGDSVASARSFFGFFTGGLDSASASVKLFQRNYLMPSAPDGYERCWPPVIYNNWPWTATHVDENLVREQIDRVSEFGIDVICVDYGWSVSAGNKNVRADRFGAGMKPLSDYAAKKGLKFGLWLSPADYDPEQTGEKDADKWVILDENRNPVMYDPACMGEYSGPCKGCLASDYKEYVKQEIDRIITDFALSYVKFDQPMFYRCYSSEHYHQNAEDAWYYQVLGYYELLEYLMKRHPGLYIENCQGGGRILDYGILRRSHGCALHDNGQNDRSRRYMYGVTYPFAREYFLRFFSPQVQTDCPNYSYNCRSAMMGTFGVGMNLAELAPDAHYHLGRNIETYKKHLRPLKGFTYHVWDQPMDDDWDVSQVWDPESRTGAIFAFRRGGPNDTIHLRLKGLEEMKWYNFNRLNRQHRGEHYMVRGLELMKNGLPITLVNAPGSQVILITPLGASECDYLNDKYPPAEEYLAEDN